MFWVGTADPGRLASAWSSADASPRQTLIAEVLTCGRPDSFRTSSSPTALRPTTTLHRCCSWSTTPRLGRRQSQRLSKLVSAQPRPLRGNECGSPSWFAARRRFPSPVEVPTSGSTLFAHRNPRMRTSTTFLTRPRQSYSMTKSYRTQNEGLCLLRHTGHSPTLLILHHRPTLLGDLVILCIRNPCSSQSTPS